MRGQVGFFEGKALKNRRSGLDSFRMKSGIERLRKRRALRDRNIDRRLDRFSVPAPGGQLFVPRRRAVVTADSIQRGK